MYKYNAVVTRVVDGDTVKVAVDLGFGVVYQTTVRLAGIDSAELKDKANRDKALAAKAYLEDKVLNKEIKLKALKTGKYGRYLGFLYFEDDKESINDKMVKAGHAKPYMERKNIKK